jgi:hypothetical protein
MGSVVKATPRPLYSRERPGTHMQDAGWGPRAGMDGGRKISLPTGIRSSDLPTRRQSLTDWAIPDPRYAMVSICDGIDMQWHRYKINQKIYSLDKANSYQIYELLQLYLITRLAVCGAFRNLLLDYWEFQTVQDDKHAVQGSCKNFYTFEIVQVCEGNIFYDWFGIHFMIGLEYILWLIWNAFYYLFGIYCMIDLEYILWLIWNTFYDWFGIYLWLIWNIFYDWFGIHFMIDLEYILWLIWNTFYDWFGIYCMIDLEYNLWLICYCTTTECNQWSCCERVSRRDSKPHPFPFYFHELI